MFYQIITKILVTEDGVYISYQNSNSLRQFERIYAPELTDLYISGGRKSLDRKILELLVSHKALLKGKNQTIQRYLTAQETDTYKTLARMYLNNLCSHKEIDEPLRNELLDTLADMMNPAPKRRKPDRL